MIKTTATYHAPAAAENAGSRIRGKVEINLAILVLFPAFDLAVAHKSGLASFRLKAVESNLWVIVEHISRKNTQFIPFCTAKHIFRLGRNKFD